MKHKTKLVNIDILNIMKGIADSHVKFYKTDFDIDIETIREAAMKPERTDRIFVWMCRTHGTWLLKEKNVFIKDSHEYSVFTCYAECTRDTILAFVVESASTVMQSQGIFMLLITRNTMSVYVRQQFQPGASSLIMSLDSEPYRLHSILRHTRIKSMDSSYHLNLCRNQKKNWKRCLEMKNRTGNASKHRYKKSRHVVKLLFFLPENNQNIERG